MEQEPKSAPRNAIGFVLLLLGGMLYGAHQNYLEFVVPKIKKFDWNWFEIAFFTVFYTVVDMLLMCLLCVDKVIYNAKFHAFVTDWSRQMHPNGDMVGLGTLIIFICLGINVIANFLHKLNNTSS